jgi:hypothetical protein
VQDEPEAGGGLMVAAHPAGHHAGRGVGGLLLDHFSIAATFVGGARSCCWHRWRSGYQCGYCTPGQVCSAVGTLDEIRRGVPSHASADLTARPLLSVEELRERMSGNICRCGAYSNIVDAISEVAGVRT